MIIIQTFVSETGRHLFWSIVSSPQ